MWFTQEIKKERISSLISFGPRNGLSPKEASYKTRVKVLKLGATTRGTLNLEEAKYVDIEPDKNSHLWLKEGDILIQRGNSADYVGCNLLIKQDLNSFIYPDLMMKIRAKNGMLPEYLSLALAAPSSRKAMWSNMTGTSGTMPKISKKVVENVEVWIPDLERQKVIVEKVDQLISLCDQLKVRLGDVQTTQTHLADAIVEQAVA